MGTNQEQVFLSRPDVTVTSARLVTPGQTYAMSGITSVTRGIIKPSRKGPIFCIVVGLFALFGGFARGDTQFALMGGGFWLAVGVVWWMATKDKHLVKLNTAGGETDAYISTDMDAVDEIIEALNEAIIARG